MKVTIAYTSPEDGEAAAVVAALQCLYPGVKVRKSDRYSPFLHLYLTTKEPGNHCNSKENA